MLPKGSSENTE